MAIGSRAFGALTDKITFPLSGATVTAAFTIAVLVKPNAGNTQSVFVEDAGKNVELYRETDGLVGWSSAGAKSTAAIPLDSEWQLLACTKAAGTVAPRLHRVRFGGPAAVHAVGDASLANASASGSWVLGWYNGSAYDFRGLLASAAVWKSALSDGAVELLATEAGWAAALPDVWWSERDGFAADRVSSLARLSISGTSHSTDEPAGWWTVSGASASVGGFPRLADGSLAMTTVTAGAGWSGGQLLAPTGELVVTTGLPVKTRGGFPRDVGDAVAVAVDAVGTWSEGFVRDVSGALCVTSAGPFSLQAGFLRDAAGRLAVQVA
jgi:hypothetical protein